MKLSLNQTKELLERVEKQLLEKKINLQEDTPRDPFGNKKIGFDELQKIYKEKRNIDKMKKQDQNILADLRRKAGDIIENNRKAKERLPDDIEEVIDKIRKMEDVTKEEISKLDLSSSVGDDIISLIQTYAKIVLGGE